MKDLAKNVASPIAHLPHATMTDEQYMKYLRLRRDGWSAYLAYRIAVQLAPRRFTWKESKYRDTVKYATVNAGVFKVILRIKRDEHYNPALVRGQLAQRLATKEQCAKALIVPHSHELTDGPRYFIPFRSVPYLRDVYNMEGASRGVADYEARKSAKQDMRKSVGLDSISAFYVHIAITDTASGVNIYDSASHSMECASIFYEQDEDFWKINATAAEMLISGIVYAKNNIENMMQNLQNLDDLRNEYEKRIS